MGCSWIHDPIGNPLSTFADQAGVARRNADHIIDLRRRADLSRSPRTRRRRPPAGRVLDPGADGAVRELLLEEALARRRRAPRAPLHGRPRRVAGGRLSEPVPRDGRTRAGPAVARRRSDRAVDRRRDRPCGRPRRRARTPRHLPPLTHDRRGAARRAEGAARDPLQPSPAPGQGLVHQARPRARPAASARDDARTPAPDPRPRIPRPRAWHVTNWLGSPYTQGGYTATALGASPEDFDVLADPVDGCVLFCGEHTHRSDTRTPTAR
jgi:hypothetical protein